MATPLLLRGIPVLRLRLHHHRLAASIFPTPRRPWCTAAKPNRTDESLSPADNFNAAWSARDPTKHPRCEDPDYGQWEDKEKEILRDIEPHHYAHQRDSPLGQNVLTDKDEKAVVEKLLAHHPDSEDKIGCGLDSIMVDRHPEFRCSRCLFVIRADGGWIDFSYQKCLRAYIRDKYPSYAARFIREHFKRHKLVL